MPELSTPFWYAVIDTAQDDRLYPLVQTSSHYACLFSGKLEPDLAAAAPYLAVVDEREPLIERWREHGAGRNWGILCETATPLEPLRKHFRRFLQAKLPDGRTALFRFYDPRVFAQYMLAASPDERAPWFDEGIRYVVEGPDGAMHDFRLRRGTLYDGDTAIG